MDQILSTKLYLPPPRTGLVQRARLIEKLNASANNKLTLISAPAGFGKTTVLSAWAQQALPHIHVAWLTLDKGDNDLERFLTYFVAAVQAIHENFGQGILAALQSPGAVNSESVLTTLLNDISSLPQNVVLILDDYNVIESRSIDEALTYLIEHTPIQFQLVLVSRIDPSLPISRLRANGQLTEMRADDLRFTLEEASAFLNQVMGLNLTSRDVKALEERTEGWIAGLHLAGLSIQGIERSDDIADFVNRFTGSDHYIQDYLADEVLQQLPEGTRDFLYQTSILERMSASLCDAVRFGEVDSQDSQEILESLEASNLFIVALDNERRWYRYHHLFSELLQNRLKRNHPDRVNALHLRAVEWFAKNEMLDEAVNHAFSAGAYERAADLIEQAASGTLLYGRLTTILGWLDSLPNVMLDSRPRLRIYQAWCLAMAGQPLVADKILLGVRSSMETLPETPENLALRGELAALRTGIIIHQNDPAEIIHEAQEALNYLPEDNVISRARVYMALGTAYAYKNDLPKATETYELGRDLALSANAPFLATANIELITEPLVYHHGRLKEAAENLVQILELGKTKDGSYQAFTGAAFVLLAEINLEWNNLEAAASYLDKGFELLRLGGIGYTLTHCYCAGARIKLAFGDIDRAVEFVQSAAQAAQASPLMHFQIRNLVCQVNLALHLRDTKTALRWARGEFCDLPEELPTHLYELQQISLARVYFAQRDYMKTNELLDQIYPAAKSAVRNTHVIDIYLLKSLAFAEQGQTTSAVECLERAISLAAPEGFMRIFLDQGETIARLLTNVAAKGILPDYTGKLLAAFDAQKKGETDSSSQLLIEPLSQRELEVLQLIAEGLSNREISEKLILALDTVKGHNHRIYGKLGVHRRTEAIARARELELL